MSAELQSCLVDVNVVSILKRPESEDDDINKEPSKKHRGASTTAEFGPPESTEIHANGGNPKEIAPSLAGNLHPKLAKALSQVPYSPLFGILWPLIVEQASFEMRDSQLRYVNHYFEALCHPHRRSDRAKSTYASYYGNLDKRKRLPFVLELSFGAEWRCWGADKCGFNNIEAFRAFCALGDIDPDKGRSWHPYAACRNVYCISPLCDSLRWIWMSRKKDVVFETSQNPLNDGYCHYFGLTGIADKAIAMCNFMHDNYGEYNEDEPDMTTMWADMVWGRGYC